ncbi:MAG: hypothetical protein H7062_04455 [Candidatus Saccharimonas sp.]|nr:hypothetical protein [Planctomycetaceae bacterium]
MMRMLSACFALCLLTGCSLFPQQTQPNQQSRATGVDPNSLPPGQWYRVTLHGEKQGSVETKYQYIGQLKQADESSITLTEVTTRRQVITTSPRRHVPYTKQRYESTNAISAQIEPAPMTVPRDRIASIDPITTEVAAELKQPAAERVGIDFRLH